MATIAEMLAAKPKTIDGLPDFLKAAAYSALQPQGATAVPAPIAKGQEMAEGQDSLAPQAPVASAPPQIIQQAAQEAPKVTPVPEPIAPAMGRTAPQGNDAPPPATIAQAVQPTKLDKGLRIAGAVAAGAEALGRGGDSGAKLLIQSRQNQAANKLEAQKIEATKDVADTRAQATTGAAGIRANAQRDVQKMRQDSAALRSEVEGAKNGLIQDAATGTWRQPNAQELAQMPLKQAVADKLAAQADLADAQTAYNTARPGLEQQKIDAQLKVAQRRIAQADERIGIARQNASLHADSVAQGAIRTEAATGVAAPGGGGGVGGGKPSGSPAQKLNIDEGTGDFTATPQYKRLSPAAQGVLRESVPIRRQLEEVMKTFESMKENNQPGTFLGDRALYSMGIHSQIGDAADTIAALELNKVVGAARVLKGSSRAMASLEQAYKHLPNLWVDSPKLIYSKLANVIQQLKMVEQDAVTFGSKSGLVSLDASGAVNEPTQRGKQPPQGGTTHFMVGNDSYDIPADKLAAFQKKFPNARKQ